ncbi:MAG: M1 family metallopeptidase [Chitinophagaceae bacterium]
MLRILSKGILPLFFLIWGFPSAFAQHGYWQQKVFYQMKVHLNVHDNLLTGTQHLEYFNESPDTLHRVFYHLYWNAFHPGSMMDVRSRELGKIRIGGQRDWDPRIGARIEHLKPDEMGYDSVLFFRMNGRPQSFKTLETILEVNLDHPIAPHSHVFFDLRFKDQVSIQIRRSGRDNAEGVRYSMSQWYPKICEYDYEGWHPTPYVGREFYGVWGDYDVKITLNRKYLVGATGYLQDPQQIGFGYQKTGTLVVKPKGKDLTWHFLAPDVHDFVWAADPHYQHISQTAGNAAHTTIHVIYLKDPAQEDAWHELLKAAIRVLPFMERHFGPYPFHQYSFIQGGDGGMEYPMATLIRGPSLGDAFHEWMHSWYQMMLGTNESMYPWMDEGFTTYAEGKISYYYYHQFADSVFADHPSQEKPFLAHLEHNLPLGEGNAYQGYYLLVRSGLAEPMTTHADHYNTNFAYEENAYSKGAVFLEQLGYIVGDRVRDKILLAYYHQWRFKHPDDEDFFRVAEKVSGLKLDWYREYWIFTTKYIDYGIDSVNAQGDSTRICLHRIGQMPMPVDLMITLRNGKKELEYIPMDLMFGIKPQGNPLLPRTVWPAWPWTNPVDNITVPIPQSEIKSIEIDPSQRMADVDRSNNRVEF